MKDWAIRRLANTSTPRLFRTMRPHCRILYFSFGMVSGLLIASLIIYKPPAQLWSVTLNSGPNDGSYSSGTNSSLPMVTRDSPFVFVGGWPRSGTTLMRVLLDVHSAIRCGPESRVVPRLLSFRQKWIDSPTEKFRLEKAGIAGVALDAAVAAFIMEIIRRNGEPAKMLCDKDPMNLKFAKSLNSMFPKARFVLMLRDGRAVVNSIIKRRVSISGVKWMKPADSIKSWEKSVRHMYNDCLDLGTKVCMPVKYENLVLQPRVWLRRIMTFLGLPWEDNLLRHWEKARQQADVKISSVEKSSDQVVYPIHLDAVDSWVYDTSLPEDFKRSGHLFAPMISELGYDTVNFPPHYGEPDPWVVNNTKKLNQDLAFRQIFGGKPNGVTHKVDPNAVKPDTTA